MSTEPTILRKLYTAPYVLDRGKLSRMVTIVEERFSEASLSFSPEFEIELKNRKNLVLRSIQDVFAIDNSVKNPIDTLTFRAPPAPEEDAVRDKTQTSVRFRFDRDKSENIVLSVASPNTKLATEISAELEEQIDRTIVRSWGARLSKRFVAYAATALALLTLALLLRWSIAYDASYRTLSPAESAELQRLLAAAKSDTEKINALVQAKLHELRVNGQPVSFLPVNWASVFSVRGAFIALPILVLIGTVGYMVAACYPWGVFNWGDYEQHYVSLVGRRKMLGIVIVAALVIGIISNLFVAALPLR